MNNDDGRLSERLEALVALTRATSDGDYLTRLATGEMIALECAEFIAEHGPALADLARRWEGAATGEVVECGDDAEGQPRVLVHSTRHELRKGEPLAFRRVRIVPDMGEGE